MTDAINKLLIKTNLTGLWNVIFICAYNKINISLTVVLYIIIVFHKVMWRRKMPFCLHMDYCLTLSGFICYTAKQQKSKYSNSNMAIYYKQDYSPVCNNLLNYGYSWICYLHFYLQLSRQLSTQVVFLSTWHEKWGEKNLSNKIHCSSLSITKKPCNFILMGFYKWSDSTTVFSFEF